MLNETRETVRSINNMAYSLAYLNIVNNICYVYTHIIVKCICIKHLTIKLH